MKKGREDCRLIWLFFLLVHILNSFSRCSFDDIIIQSFRLTKTLCFCPFWCAGPGGTSVSRIRMSSFWYRHQTTAILRLWWQAWYLSFAAGLFVLAIGAIVANGSAVAQTKSDRSVSSKSRFNWRVGSNLLCLMYSTPSDDLQIWMRLFTNG